MNKIGDVIKALNLLICRMTAMQQDARVSYILRSWRLGLDGRVGKHTDALGHDFVPRNTLGLLEDRWASGLLPDGRFSS